jgi:hypothetical protein
MEGKGFLAIWSDVAAQQETDYLHWLTREHSSERLSVEGFLGTRVYRCLHLPVSRYFIHYTLRSADVLGSAQYLARLNAPTPWTQRIMQIVGNFGRGGGRVVARAGTGQGGVLAAIKLDTLAGMDGAGTVEGIVCGDCISAAELLETDQGQTAIQTREKNIRSGDQSFAGLLLIEGLHEAAVAAAVRKTQLPIEGNIYTEVFQL